MSGSRFLFAAVVSAGVILSSPFIRDIRDWIRGAFPGRYATVVAAAVALALVAALVAAAIMIRDRRARRYGAIALAFVLGTAYALWNAQGRAEVDAVERVHFVEYGLITLLFYRAWKPTRDVSMFVLPILAGLAVGTLEEWLQWFIPGRVGDMRDVFLNGVAILCGLLFSVGIDPPDARVLTPGPASIRRIGMFASGVLLLFASFVDSVHIGYEVRDPDAGRFRSRYDVPALAALSRDRALLWTEHPPIERPRSRSREDQYMSEGLLHAQERNRLWEAGDVAAAWSENVMLEKYFAPLLDAPSYISPTGLRWPAAQRADAERRRAPISSSSSSRGPVADYESRADATEGRHFIRIWPPMLFWLAVALAIGLMLGVSVVLGRQGQPRSSSA